MGRGAEIFMLTPRLTFLLLAVLTSTSGCPLVCDSPPGSESVDLSIDTDLYTVVSLDSTSGERHYDFLAAGASGIVAVWGTDNGGEPFVDVFDLGEFDLRAAWIDKSNPSSEVWRWWVVGDNALIMTSNNHGVIWEIAEVQSSANLYGVAGVADHPIVVGDDIIMWASLDWTWVELTPPAGNWGQLRGISAYSTNETRIEVVGLGGVIWATNDPSGEWTLEPSGVTNDLFAVDYGVAVGAEGTLLRHTDNGWIRSETGVDVDLIDYEGGYALGANGEVYEVTADEPLTLIDTKPGARALTNHFDGWATVGDDGGASKPAASECD
jgi:hypothetical protein